MEFNQLTHFLAVARHGSFARAAKHVALSQPALSRSIARLEEELGRPLFERQSRQVVLTDVGRMLQPRARQILELASQAKAEITDDGETGRLRIGAIPTIAPYLLPRVLATFREAVPRAELVVSEDVTDNLLRACTNGDVDVAIMAMPVEPRYLEVERLFDDELLLVLPAAHPLTTAKAVSLDDLQDHPFVLLNEAHCLTGNVVSACRQQSVDLISVERTHQLAMVLELVSLGHGVSLIPSMARRCDDDRRRVYRSLPSCPSRQIVMVWNQYRYQTKLLGHFLDLLRSVEALGPPRSATA